MRAVNVLFLCTKRGLPPTLDLFRRLNIKLKNVLQTNLFLIRGKKYLLTWLGKMFKNLLLKQIHMF